MRNFWKRLPIAAKFTFVFVSIGTILISFVTFITTNSLREQARQELESEADILLVALSQSSDNDIVGFNTNRLSNLAEELANSSDEVISVSFYSNTGRIIATNDEDINVFSIEPNPLGTQILASEDILTWNESSLVAGTTVNIERNLVGAISLELSSERINAEIATATLTTIIFASGTIILISVVIYLVSRTIANPLRDLVEASRQIAEGDYAYPVDIDAGGEVGELSEAFVAMKDAVAERTKDLQRATREAREASRLKDEFLAVMSHELRTPLNAIIGFQGIMKMRGTLDEKSLHQVNRTRANAERLLGIINDILDISRIESGRLQLTPVPLSIQNLADNWRSQMSILAEEKNLDFVVKVDEKLPDTIMMDEEAITKVVTNLLGNAFKFTETGGVTLRLQKEDTILKIEVEDTGVGIPLHMQDIIFERFRQVDGSAKRRFGGSGLGLAIVQNLCREMGGQVSIRSTPDVGSTFTVTLPIEVAELAGVPA